MAKGKPDQNEQMIDLLQKLLIIELAKGGVPQNEIKKILGIGIEKVNSLLKNFNKTK